MTTLTYTGALIVTTCWCGIAQAIPDDLYRWAQQNHNREVWCPLGHKWVVAGETEAQKLQRQLNWERDRLASTRADLDQTQRSLSATRGVVTKLRKRATAGLCPFGCRRHFVQLERHVERMHPGAAFDAETTA